MIKDNYFEIGLLLCIPAIMWLADPINIILLALIGIGLMSYAIGLMSYAVIKMFITWRKKERRRLLFNQRISKRKNETIQKKT